MARIKPAAVSRLGWFNYYVTRYNKDPSNGAAAWLATWLYLLMLAEDEGDL